MPGPGFTEIDLVAHSGDRADGEFIHSLNLTDIHTTWVETRAVMGKSQHFVQEALDHMRQQLPFRLKGIDSDNGLEFINHHLRGYCATQDIQFTRGRPYKKDDNAHIEQRIRRRYDAPRTPLERVETCTEADSEKLRALRQLRARPQNGFHSPHAPLLLRTRR